MPVTESCLCYKNALSFWKYKHVVICKLLTLKKKKKNFGITQIEIFFVNLTGIKKGKLLFDLKSDWAKKNKVIFLFIALVNF